MLIEDKGSNKTLDVGTLAEIYIINLLKYSKNSYTKEEIIDKLKHVLNESVLSEKINELLKRNKIQNNNGGKILLVDSVFKTDSLNNQTEKDILENAKKDLKEQLTKNSEWNYDKKEIDKMVKERFKYKRKV